MTSSIDRLCGIERTSVNQDENFAEKIQDKMRKSQENQKRQYDSKVRDQIKFDIADLVILVNSRTRPGQVRSFEPKFIGPYKILEQVTDVNFKIVDVNNQKSTLVVHYNRMRKYNERKPEEMSNNTLVTLNKPLINVSPIDEEADINNQILMQALVNNRSISVPNNNNENVINVNSIVQPVLVEIALNSKSDELNLDPNQPLNLVSRKSDILSETLADLIDELTEENQVKTSTTRNIYQIDSINESRLNKNLSESQLEASSGESGKSEDELVANVVTAEEAKNEMDLPIPDEDGWLTCNFKNCADRFATPFGLKVHACRMHKVKFVESKIQASSTIITPTNDNESLAAVGSIENLNTSSSGTPMDIMYS
ncbi:unnamed protein product [Brachionus calyciflorus]|uniref:C2H2-type domain-containing protein n=1 Tax=Brachionus calyciflorus TaxID=104777 RepID=A0A814D380_9BILA|nr:unnamed protein product [Brachionus calyciflorus]